jgi:hypothetical protein
MMGRCPSCGRREKHSDKQRGFYWLMLGAMAMSLKPKGEEFSPEAWHEYFTERMLGFHEIKLPNGQLRHRRKSISDLDKDEFTDYQMKVEVWAAEHGFCMPDREGR